jgi:hypothetical protein
VRRNIIANPKLFLVCLSGAHWAVFILTGTLRQQVLGEVEAEKQMREHLIYINIDHTTQFTSAVLGENKDCPAFYLYAEISINFSVLTGPVLDFAMPKTGDAPAGRLLKYTSYLFKNPKYY